MSKRTSHLREQSVDSLKGTLAEEKSLLAKEKSLSVSGTKAEKPSNIRKMRRNIARVLTIIMEKEGEKQKE